MKCLNCNLDISDTLEEGVNGSDYYECGVCMKSFNVIEGEVKE